MTRWGFVLHPQQLHGDSAGLDKPCLCDKVGLVVCECKWFTRGASRLKGSRGGVLFELGRPAHTRTLPFAVLT
jgi:hypothetical protein